MCANMKEFKTVTEKIYELEQEKAEKKREIDALDKQIRQLKNETSSYMKKRQKTATSLRYPCSCEDKQIPAFLCIFYSESC